MIRGFIEAQKDGQDGAYLFFYHSIWFVGKRWVWLVKAIWKFEKRWLGVEPNICPKCGWVCTWELRYGILYRIYCQTCTTKLSGFWAKGVLDLLKSNHNRS